MSTSNDRNMKIVFARVAFGVAVWDVTTLAVQIYFVVLARTIAFMAEMAFSPVLWAK